MTTINRVNTGTPGTAAILAYTAATFSPVIYNSAKTHSFTMNAASAGSSRLINNMYFYTLYAQWDDKGTITSGEAIFIYIGNTVGATVKGTVGINGYLNYYAHAEATRAQLINNGAVSSDLVTLSGVSTTLSGAAILASAFPTSGNLVLTGAIMLA